MKNVVKRFIDITKIGRCSYKSDIMKEYLITLAKKLNYRFLDTDREIENLIGMSVDKIFEVKGEEYFRNLESQFIRKLEVSNTVISTGGGLPCFHNNIEYLNKIGITVYLKYSAEELFERIKNDANHRPLLKNKQEEELYVYIRELLKERVNCYSKAMYIY